MQRTSDRVSNLVAQKLVASARSTADVDPEVRHWELGPEFVRSVLLGGRPRRIDELEEGRVVADVRVDEVTPKIVVEIFKIDYLRERLWDASSHARCSASVARVEIGCVLPNGDPGSLAFTLDRAFRAGGLEIRRVSPLCPSNRAGEDRGGDCRAGTLTYRNGQVHYVPGPQHTRVGSSAAVMNYGSPRLRQSKLAPSDRRDERYRALAGAPGFFSAPGVWIVPELFFQRLKKQCGF